MDPELIIKKIEVDFNAASSESLAFGSLLAGIYRRRTKEISHEFIIFNKIISVFFSNYLDMSDSANQKIQEFSKSICKHIEKRLWHKILIIMKEKMKLPGLNNTEYNKKAIILLGIIDNSDYLHIHTQLKDGLSYREDDNDIKLSVEDIVNLLCRDDREKMMDQLVHHVLEDLSNYYISFKPVILSVLAALNSKKIIRFIETEILAIKREYPSKDLNSAIFSLLMKTTIGLFRIYEKYHFEKIFLSVEIYNNALSNIKSYEFLPFNININALEHDLLNIMSYKLSFDGKNILCFIRKDFDENVKKEFIKLLIDLFNHNDDFHLIEVKENVYSKNNDACLLALYDLEKIDDKIHNLNILKESLEPGEIISDPLNEKYYTAADIDQELKSLALEATRKLEAFNRELIALVKSKLPLIHRDRFISAETEHSIIETIKRLQSSSPLFQDPLTDDDLDKLYKTLSDICMKPKTNVITFVSDDPLQTETSSSTSSETAASSEAAIATQEVQEYATSFRLALDNAIAPCFLSLWNDYTDYCEIQLDLINELEALDSDTRRHILGNLDTEDFHEAISSYLPSWSTDTDIDMQLKKAMHLRSTLIKQINDLYLVQQTLSIQLEQKPESKTRNKLEGKIRSKQLEIDEVYNEYLNNRAVIAGAILDANSNNLSRQLSLLKRDESTGYSEVADSPSAATIVDKTNTPEVEISHATAIFSCIDDGVAALPTHAGRKEPPSLCAGTTPTIFNTKNLQRTKRSLLADGEERLTQSGDEKRQCTRHTYP